MVFNTTFNNISVILLRSVLLVEETGIPDENELFCYHFNNTFTMMYWFITLYMQNRL